MGNIIDFYYLLLEDMTELIEKLTDGLDRVKNSKNIINVYNNTSGIDFGSLSADYNYFIP